MKKSKFPYILGLAAFGTASVAAWFSVTGLGKLFAGASLSVMIMAGVLEFAKLVVASYVYRYWKKIKFLEKTYLIIALTILMTITSAGIYGYLSGAYSETSSKLQISNGEISLFDKKKEQFEGRIKNTEENINKKNNRLTSLNNLRSSQETRLDSLYARKYYRQAKVVEGQIKDADSEIKRFTRETDSLLNVVNGYNEEIAKLDLGTTEKKADNLKGEAAPLQYIANLFNTSMDKVVNFFMFLLIFVCDPLAIMLVIATNKVLLSDSEENKEESIVEEKPLNEAIKENLNPEPEEELAKAPEEFNEIGVEESIVEEIETPAVKESEIEPPIIEEPIVEPENTIRDKSDQVINYMADEEGNFKPIQEVPKVEEVKVEELVLDEAQRLILAEIKSQGIEHNANFLNLLDVLFDNGKLTVGDIFPTWKNFLSLIRERGFKCTEKEVKDFLTICNLNKITDMSNTRRAAIAKDYVTSKPIITLFSK